jgi:hypothetical protein
MNEPRRSAEEHVAQPPPGALAAPIRANAQEDQIPRSHHSHKFRRAIVILGGVGIAALAVALSLAAFGGARKSSISGWSSFQPQSNGLQGAQDIADFIAPFYRASPAYQLATIRAMNLNDPSNPTQLVIPASGSKGTAGLARLNPKNTMAYELCGLGSTDCSIGIGKPSSDRLLLLRREALELALYTFKYLDGIQNVVAILPPGRTVQGCTGICPKPRTTQSTKPLDVALAFDKKELQPWLNRPLRQTLPEEVPPSVTQMASAPEAELISFITSHGLFDEKTEQAQDGSTLLVLSPMPPQ